MKTALLGMKSSKPRGKNETLSAASVAKLLNGIRAVLEWATRESYIDANPAHGVSRVAALATKNGDQEDRRLPFSVEQARAITAKLPTDGELRYVTLISLYSGARLAEIVGLRQEDWREEEGVAFFDIRPHDGRTLKTKASRRRAPYTRSF